MLSADHRLRDSFAFRRTVRSGRRAGGAALVVHLLDAAAAGGTSARVGLVVGKGVGNAVVRNRVKRRLRHLVRDSLTSLPMSSELVVRALPAAADLSSAELGAELARCLQRVAVAGLPSEPTSDPADDPAGATRTGAAS